MSLAWQSHGFYRSLPRPFLLQLIERELESIQKMRHEIVKARQVHFGQGLARLARGGYSAVVGTGSGTFYAVKALARWLGVKGGVVLYPRGYRIATFDCILAPTFDRPAKAPNVIEIPANLVANDAAFYAAGTAAFQTRHPFPHPTHPVPAVAVIIGGPNACSSMTPDWMRTQLTRIFTEHGHPAFRPAPSGTTSPVP